MKVILIRHGIAQDLTFEIRDEDRELTQKGRQKLEVNMPYLVEYLKGKKVKLFSSPLVRAIQTAQYLPYEIEIVDFMAFGQSEELVESVHSHPEFDVLIYVGHEPSLSIWCEELFDIDLEVKKGMAIEIDWPHKVIRALKLGEYNQWL